MDTRTDGTSKTLVQFTSPSSSGQLSALSIVQLFLALLLLTTKSQNIKSKEKLRERERDVQRITVKCPISPQTNNVFPQHKLQKRKPAEQLGRNRANQTEAELETMWRNCRVQVQVQLESRRGKAQRGHWSSRVHWVLAQYVISQLKTTRVYDCFKWDLFSKKTFAAVNRKGRQHIDLALVKFTAWASNWEWSRIMNNNNNVTRT